MPDPYLVTGCASGIGYAVAGQLAATGHEVIGFDRHQHGPPGVEVRVVDLRDAERVERAVAGLPERLAGLANVAGLPGSHPAAQVLAVNVLALRRLAEAGAARVRRGGAVVNVSSVAAYRSTVTDQTVDDLLAADGWDEAAAVAVGLGLDGPATYDFSKKVVNALTLACARRWLDAGVRCLTVSPGPVATPILDDFTATMGVTGMQAALDVVGRHGTADEVAAVVVFALGPGARWINATDLRVDGGLLGVRSARQGAAR